MKKRLTTGWSFMRIIYLLMGVLILSQSIADRQWMLSFVGLYFIAMALFALGCAGGTCYVPPVSTKKNSSITDFEEVK